MKFKQLLLSKPLSAAKIKKYIFYIFSKFIIMVITPFIKRIDFNIILCKQGNITCKYYKYNSFHKKEVQV